MLEVGIINIIAAITILATVCAVLGRSLILARTHPGYRFGPKTIQLTALGTVVPLILILSLSGKLEGQVLGTLLGALIGYAAGNVERLPK